MTTIEWTRGDDGRRCVMVHRSRTGEPSPTRARRGWGLLATAVDRLVALTGGTCLFIGALLLVTGNPDASLPWLMLGGLLLVADAGVTTRLRVARLEAQHEAEEES